MFPVTFGEGSDMPALMRRHVNGQGAAGACVRSDRKIVAEATGRMGQKEDVETTERDGRRRWELLWRSRSCGTGTHPRCAGGFAGALRCPGDGERRDGRRSDDRGPAGPRGENGRTRRRRFAGETSLSMVLDRCRCGRPEEMGLFRPEGLF